jgi:[NiFe] hydrogenase diaphorase moiety large subunit
MLTGTGQILDDELAQLTGRYGRGRDALIPILQEVHRRYRYVSSDAMQVIADALGLHPVEVHSVLSFYSFLGTKPRGRFVIRLCRTISCDMQGKTSVACQLENDLGIGFGETTPDGRFTLEWANCIGMCDQGPAMLGNDRLYTRVTPDQVNEILDECRSAFGVHALQVEEGR